MASGQDLIELSWWNKQKEEQTMLEKILPFFIALSFAMTSSRGNEQNHRGFAQANLDNSVNFNAAPSQRLEALNTNDNICLRDYYAPYYFNNLTHNYGSNEHNSCGYIATGMLLSFWDTYWDDNIVEERYETHTVLSSNHITLEVESPGATREDEATYINTSASEYHDNITTYKNDYLHYLLLDIGKNYSLNSEGNYLVNGETIKELSQHYIYDYRGYARETVDVELFASRDSNSVKQKAIQYVKQGIPVALCVHPDSYGQIGHVVVAYDYYEPTDRLYCHFGWGTNQTHKTAEVKGYYVYDSVVAFVFKNEHSHSNNYEYHDGDRIITHCACETAAPNNIIDDFNYVDVAPVFEWDGLKEKWFLSKGHYEVRFLRSNNYTVFRHINVNMSHIFMLGKEDVRAISRNLYHDVSYIVDVALYEDIGNTTLISSYGKTCYSPTRFLSASNIYLQLSLPRKSGSTWTVRVKNTTYVKIQGQYNRKMCNLNDAKTWSSSLVDLSDFTIEPLSYVDLTFSENWFATSIVVSTVFNGKRYITYADNLKSGSLKEYRNLINA